MISYKELIGDKNIRLIFAAAIIIRLFFLYLFWDQPLVIVDEQHYATIAENLVGVGEYSLQVAKPTAIRPPLYPFLLATAEFYFGEARYNVVRILQSILSVFSAFLIFDLVKSFISNKKVIQCTLFFCLFYPSILVYNFLILTEVLFIFLFLAAFLFLLISIKSEQIWPFAVLGVTLALASLTRSITYPLALPLAILMLIIIKNQSLRRSFIKTSIYLLFFFLTLSPWIYRNYILFSEFIPVDTMGGLNLYMGNYEHTPLHRSWAAVDIEGPKAWYTGHDELSRLNEGQKQKWAIQNALIFIKDNPGLTLLRSLIKAANFWGLERSIIAAMSGQREQIHAISNTPVREVLTTAILASTIFITLSGFIGLCIRCSSNKNRNIFDLLTALLLLYFTAMHALVFGHSRYHLPLTPFLCFYSGWFLCHIKEIQKDYRVLFIISSSCVYIVFSIIWGYEIFVGSRDKIIFLLSAYFKL